MTKDASFKKAVRRLAEETGQRYTEALSDLEGLGVRMDHEPVLRAPDYAVLSEQWPIAINWKASGRGPRLADFAYLIWPRVGGIHVCRTRSGSTLPSTPTADMSSRPTTNSTGSKRSCISGRSTSPVSATGAPSQTARHSTNGASSSRRVLQLHRSCGPSRVPPVSRRCGYGTMAVRQSLVGRMSHSVLQPVASTLAPGGADGVSTRVILRVA